MARQTLLQMTQTILAALDSDAINSISDTVESTQVAQIIQNKYYDILSRDSLPSQETLFQLVASGDVTKPVLMTLPSGCANMQWLKYYDVNPANNQQQDQFGSFSHGLNTDIVPTSFWTTTSSTSNTISVGSKTFTVAASLPIQINQGCLCSSGANTMFGTVTSYSGTTLVVNITSTAGSGTFSSWTITNSTTASIPGYKYVTVLPIEEFIEYVNRFNLGDSNVASFTFVEGGNNFTFNYLTNITPRYCTVIENNYVVFDSFDSTFDSTLQGSKTMAYGLIVTPFTLSDSFIPDLDDNQFPLLINEAKTLAFYELKQMPHPIADREVKRQWSTVQKTKSKSGKPTYFEQLPYFGRMPRTGGYAGSGWTVYGWMKQR
jgi:hypothetical protein